VKASRGCSFKGIPYGFNHFLQSSPFVFSNHHEFYAGAVSFVGCRLLCVNDPSSGLDHFILKAEGDKNVLSYLKGTVGFEQKSCFAQISSAAHTPAGVVPLVIQDNVFHETQLILSIMFALSEFYHGLPFFVMALNNDILSKQKGDCKRNRSEPSLIDIFTGVPKFQKNGNGEEVRK
jgi:hypothetical protein